ncbi:hypothetical protein ACRBEV_28265 [Methylobacterium phyllosphaerae]
MTPERDPDRDPAAVLDERGGAVAIPGFVAAAALIVGSRLVHTRDLDAYRTTLPGQDFLGSSVSLWNLRAYAAGLAASLHRERRRAALPA